MSNLDGVIQYEVLELDPENVLRISWQGGNLVSTVTRRLQRDQVIPTGLLGGGGKAKSPPASRASSARNRCYSFAIQVNGMSIVTSVPLPTRVCQSIVPPSSPWMSVLTI